MLRAYSSFADYAVVVLCVVISLLKHSTYINRTKRFRIIELTLGLLVLSAFSNITFYNLSHLVGSIPNGVFYLLKFTYEAPLLGVFVCFINYLDRLLQIDTKMRHKNFSWCILFLIIFCLLMLLSPVTKFGFHIVNNQMVNNYFLNPFSIGYVFYMGMIAYGLIKFRKFFFERIFRCIIKTASIACLIVLIQASIENSSFIVLSFFLPVFMMFYLFHSSPYDFSIGTLNYESFNFYIEALNKNNKDYGLLFVNFAITGVFFKVNIQTKRVLYGIYEKYFGNPFVFRISDDVFCLVYDRKVFKTEKLEALKQDFLKLYEYAKLDFKFILMDEHNAVNDVSDILDFYRYISNKMAINEFHFCEEADFQKFTKHQYILNELKDIAKKNDLNDERVLVYCQPIFNVEKGNFVTAEALMRLRLPELGMVYPDMFIELAEKHNLIHSLSKIILNKTCQAIEQLQKEHYEIERISINFAMSEFDSEIFCYDVLSIIDKHEIERDKIAIELTESENNRSRTLKEKMDYLKERGLKFYLDDYGSGYSNLERIMELPLDVIKFDRSLLLLSAESNSYKYMVDNFANVFSKLDYKVLFEGVENETDETSCIGMKANYLQGYKYSKPIPIENLKDFLTKK